MFPFSLATSTVVIVSSFLRLVLLAGLQRESLRLTRTMLVAFALSIPLAFFTGMTVTIPAVCACFVFLLRVLLSDKVPELSTEGSAMLLRGGPSLF